MAMANNHVCLECGVSGVKKDLVNCSNCCSYSVHRYCMIEWPNTRRGPVSWFCGCQDLPIDQSVEHDEISNGSGFTVKGEESENESEEVISSQFNVIDAKEEEEVSNELEGVEKESMNSETSRNHPKKTKESNSSSGTNRMRHNKLPTKFMKSFTSYGNLYGPGKHAEPIIRSIWSGSFQIQFMMRNEVRPVNGMTAFLSNKVDEGLWDESVEFGEVIRPEMVWKDLVWPSCFEETGPKDEDIAVYFFSSLGVEQQVYDCLVFEMMRDDLAMRVELGNAEILIFTSVDLIPRLRRFQGKWYLWGFFRLKHRRNDEHESLSGPDFGSSC